MKNIRLAALGAALLVTAALMITACSNILAEPKGAGSASPEDFGTVRVNVGSAARTAMPSAPAGMTYRYFFDLDGVAQATADTVPQDGGTFSLARGTYALRVKAFVSIAGADALVAQGTSAQFTVEGADTQNISVTLNPIVDEGTGKLDFTLHYPQVADLDWFYLESMFMNFNYLTEYDETDDGVITTLTGIEEDIAAGYYWLQISLSKADGTSTEIREAVHIYANLTTVVSYTVTDAEFIGATDSTIALDDARLGLTASYATAIPAGIVAVDVSNTIEITPVKAGNAIILVYASNGDMAVIPVTVTAAGVVNIGTIVGAGAEPDSDFTVATNATTANTEAVLGIVGTDVSSSDDSIATVEITGGTISITSVAPGSAIIIVSDDISREASIVVTVNTHGAITILSTNKWVTIPLTDGAWADGELDSGDVFWYSFTAASEEATYYVQWNDSYDGDGTKTGGHICNRLWRRRHKYME
jgi:hypothetical protein